MSTTNLPFPTTLQEAMVYFADPKRGLDFMVSLRWPNGKVTCPHCQSEKVSFLSTRSKWKCMACHKQFSAKVGTLFEDSALGYDKWFPAMWLIVNAKNGISSYEIGRALGVTQKTAWFMLQRIRLAMQTGTFEKLKGDVEVDETYIGGLAKNMHMRKRLKRITATGSLNKVAVIGFLERGGRARAAMLKEPTREIMDPLVRQTVKKGSRVLTDEHTGYFRLKDEYRHQFVRHRETYVNGDVHTNNIENFWSLLKRTLRGTYVSVDPVHLSRYLDEQMFRFNERKDCDAGRFLKAVSGVVGKSLTYLDLMKGKGGEDLLPA